MLVVALLVGADCLVVVDDLFPAPVALLLFCLVVLLEFTVSLPVLLWLLVALLLFTVPLLFLVGSDWRCVDWFPLPVLFVLLLLLLSVASL